MIEKNRSQLTLESAVCQSNDQVGADMDGEVALMSIETGKYYCLNSTSTRIWQLIAKRRRIAQVCDALVDEFEVDRRDCESQVLEHIKELVDDRLVELVDT